ncbi:glutamate-1-semialdehyde 2,1-aminomutase [Luteitalea sp.]|uniref:glutamate-1-semialdehyde 2,1-aminomutase n=1 Tax=Luteitalea sp. TaxID=2004800 RepID=UPI0025C70E70|nr:glutamate-1-semialdehyde 2,1-aminomutase [Luteitalea sp.]
MPFATTVGGQSWIARARHVTPGGVHSPVRAFGSVGCEPLAIASARGATVVDVEGRTFIDCIGAWGPALLGHAHPAIESAVVDAVRRGLIFGLASPGEVELASRIVSRLPSCQMVRFTVSGTEATMSAVRVARAATGRAVVVKFAGGYHGHADAFLVAAGSGAATLGIPDSPGVSEAVSRDTVVARFNDLASVDACFAATPGQVAAVIVEPVVGNMGCVPPETGFLEGLRRRCTEHGAVLIFDEVMTGFRVSRGGASERYGVAPDLVAMAKVLGGGMPLAAFGGRRSLMQLVAPAGQVYQAGTYAAHPVSVAAGLAMLDAIDAEPGLYDALERRGAQLEAGLRRAAETAGVPVAVQRVGSMFTVFFSAGPVRSWDDAAHVDRAAFGRFFRAMLARGVLLPPSAFEAAFLSLAHDEAVIATIITAAESAFREARA